MRCPKCSSDELKVLETRAGTSASTRRRRVCLKCNHRFSTMEEVLREDLVVVKRDGRRESFDRTKLAMGLRRAIAKRPIELSKSTPCFRIPSVGLKMNSAMRCQPCDCGCDHARLPGGCDRVAAIRKFLPGFHGLSRFAKS